MKDVDLAWLAGILEGEGCFYLTTRHNKSGEPRPLLSVMVSMTDEDIVRRVAAITGVGSVCPRERTKEGYKPSWTWQTSKVEVIVPLLLSLLPWMGERRSTKIREMLAAADGYERRPVRTHGELRMYRSGCRCALCRRTNAIYHRKYKPSHRNAPAPESLSTTAAATTAEPATPC